MPKPFPQFSEPNPLPGEGTWTAEFESYDMRQDTAYYYVTRTGADEGDDEYFVRLHVSGGVPDEEELRAQLERQAELGTANTDYTGSMMWRMRRQKAKEAEGRQ